MSFLDLFLESKDLRYLTSLPLTSLHIPYNVYPWYIQNRDMQHIKRESCNRLLILVLQVEQLRRESKSITIDSVAIVIKANSKVNPKRNPSEKAGQIQSVTHKRSPKQAVVKKTPDKSKI